MTLKKHHKQKYRRLSKKIKNHDEVLKMKKYIQHGRISTYDHVNDVAELAYGLAKKLKLDIDDKVLIEGALLHDFFGYDWHDDKEKKPLFKMHGFTHANEAAKRAKEIFNIDDKTEHVINSHMWPLTLRCLPKSKEAILVCVADKIVSCKETLLKR